MFRSVFLLRQEDPSSEEVQKTDVETKRSLKPTVYLHFKMVHGTETCPVAAGVGWQVLSSIFLSCSHAGFLSLQLFYHSSLECWFPVYPYACPWSFHFTSLQSIRCLMRPFQSILMRYIFCISNRVWQHLDSLGPYIHISFSSSSSLTFLFIIHNHFQALISV